MPEYHRGQQQSPSPSSKTGPMLPPLSKYYYGPAQGWNSADSSPSHNGICYCILPSKPHPHQFTGSSWSANHHDIPPSLPPRLSPGPPAYSPPQWMNHSPYAAEASQGWHSPGLPPSASPASQHANVTQNPDGYAPKPDTSHSRVNPIWDSGPLEISKGGVNYSQKAAQDSQPASKPPLPVSPYLQIFYIQF